VRSVPGWGPEIPQAARTSCMEQKKEKKSRMEKYKPEVVIV